MDKKILIVEDEFIVADDVQLTLERGGYEVCGIATSVLEAREMVEKKKPSLVLLDIYLKGQLSGIELAKELKEKTIAFVYLSANSNQKILEAAKATEPYGFLVKPFREKDLLVTLDVAFYRHEHSLEARWRRELQLQKQLVNIQQAPGSLEQKLLMTAKVLQPYIPFDCIAFKLRMQDNKNFAHFAFLRIGFDEYQVIGIPELSVIAGIKPGEVKDMLTDTTAEYSAGWYNGEEFKKLLQTQPTKKLFAETFTLSSNLVVPLLSSDGYVFLLNLFSSKPNEYNSEQLDWLFRLLQPMTAILDSIPKIEKSAALGTTYNLKSISEKAVQTTSSFEGIIGNCTALLNVLDMVAMVAPLDTSVLILGESGTGKERIAEQIHQLSLRKEKPLIKINCAALPPTLIESELFGHEKGSFTGAFEKRIGKFEQSHNGTIFLDEIGEMPAELQVKLLRVLQEKEIERIGGKQTIKVDVRVIAATNRDLQNEMSAGRFRLDLYYRLNVFPITIPPLRERKEDIGKLAYFFAANFSKRYDKPFHKISNQMLSELEAYNWPGNIRELENIIEQTMILNDGTFELVLRKPLLGNINPNSNNVKDTHENETVKTIEDIKRLQRQTEIEHISSVLAKTGGRVRGKDGAAELLNEKPTTLESRMAKLGIKKESFQ